MPHKIYFYRQYHKYGEFSNFYSAEIMIDNYKYPTTEHYFQAMKFFPINIEYFNKIRLSKSPNDAFKLGKSKIYKIRDDWNEIKDDIMRKALKAKFTQHPNLKEVLINTNESVLIEHTERDNYWADGGDGSGKNMLGKLLMELRSQLM